MATRRATTDGLSRSRYANRAAPSMRRARYLPPSTIDDVALTELIAGGGREALQSKQLDFLKVDSNSADLPIYYAGDLSLIGAPSVSIVGTRDVSDEGRLRARKLARELASAGVTVVSGLARGVDTAAHTAAIEAGGKTIAVVGTPLDKAYPAENADLQQKIYQDHLLLSPFRKGEQVYKANFPKRNRVMAAISDATVIVEASDTSGTLHQAAECLRLGRWLFIMRSVVDDKTLIWPSKFLGSSGVAVLNSTNDLLEVIKRK